MTKYILNLKILHRVVAVLHFLQGLFMTFGGRNIAEQYGWDYSIGFAAMAEHHGSTLICVSIYFWFLPKFLNLENLKRVSILGLVVQAILILMPIYHAMFGYFPIDPSFYVMIFVLTLIMVLFFLASRDDSQNE